MNRISLFLLLLCAGITHAQQPVIITFDESNDSTIISKNIYGQFAEHLGRSIYDGFYYNGKIRTDIVEALRKIRVPNLRWPGGCFADQYHWRDGIGPMNKRPGTINTTWGMVKEDNHFGTDEFLQLCALIGCEPYLAGNVGTGNPQEMKDWIEYLNLKDSSTLADLRMANGHAKPYRVSLWGVGNESWGCGGNMRPEYYADLYKHYASFLPDYPGAQLKKIISGANADDYHWTEVMMQNIHPGEAWGLSLHYYTFPTGKWNPRGSATAFTQGEYAHSLVEAMKMKTIIDSNEHIMDRYDPAKKIALLVDEWGVWTDVEPGTPAYAMYQQNSLRDALIAATTLNIFNTHAARVRGANLAQTVNVIHSVILTKDDKMLLTPTYHVFDLYQVHQDSRLIPLHFNSPLYINAKDSVDAISASASKDSLGTIHITLVNLDPNKAIVVQLPFPGKDLSSQILTSANLNDINTFERPDKVVVQKFSGFTLQNSASKVTLPPHSIVMVTVK